MNSHRFTGTKMFNRHAGDGLILGGLEYRDSDGLLNLKNTSVTRLVITSLSNLYYHGKLDSDFLYMGRCLLHFHYICLRQVVGSQYRDSSRDKVE